MSHVRAGGVSSRGRVQARFGHFSGSSLTHNCLQVFQVLNEFPLWLRHFQHFFQRLHFGTKFFTNYCDFSPPLSLSLSLFLSGAIYKTRVYVCICTTLGGDSTAGKKKNILRSCVIMETVRVFPPFFLLLSNTFGVIKSK